MIQENDGGLYYHPRQQWKLLEAFVFWIYLIGEAKFISEVKPNIINNLVKKKSSSANLLKLRLSGLNIHH